MACPPWCGSAVSALAASMLSGALGLLPAPAPARAEPLRLCSSYHPPPRPHCRPGWIQICDNLVRCKDGTKTGQLCMRWRACVRMVPPLPHP
jgi:hypothetical protein